MGWLLLLLLMLGGCDRTMTLTAADAASLEIGSGETGARVTVKGADTLRTITEGITGLRYAPAGTGRESTGWRYTLQWYDAAGEPLLAVTLLAEDLLDWEEGRYTPLDGTIDLAAIEALFAEPESAPEPQPAPADRLPMVRVDGRLYCDTGCERVGSLRCGVMDGEITAQVPPSEIPTEDGQSNFGTGYRYQISGEETIDVEIDGRWYIFAWEDAPSTVTFAGRTIDRADLSAATLDWLAWYNSLPEETQLAVSFIPSDLLEAIGLSGSETTDADQPAVESES